jgi:uncharacterized protein
MDLLERTSIIGEIARRKQGGQLGKTAVMKLLHLLQDGLGVPLGYRFTLYNYGPYNTEVMSDIEFAESLKRVTVNYEGPDHGYRIMAGSDVGELPQGVESKLNKLIKDFGAMNARELELRSTLLFLSRSYSDKQLITRLRELKPKYSEPEARAALDDLQNKGLANPGER